jgi:hypothetical protein
MYGLSRKGQAGQRAVGELRITRLSAAMATWKSDSKCEPKVKKRVTVSLQEAVIAADVAANASVSGSKLVRHNANVLPSVVQQRDIHFSRQSRPAILAAS